MKKEEWENLRSVKGLDLPEFLTNIQEMDFDQDLNKFIERLPAMSFEFVKLFVAKDYTFLQAKLDEMAASLRRIRAEKAAGKCDEVIAFLSSDMAKTEVDVHLQNLISELNTLSVDIQTLEYKSRENSRSFEKKNENKGPKYILAVDDDPVILDVLKRAIISVRYRFSGVTAGKTALKYLETHTPPDLIILDIEMPEMNGYQVAEAIVAKDSSIPIIFLTSNATREHIIKAMQTGAVDFLVKPVNEELIMSKLDKYLG